MPKVAVSLVVVLLVLGAPVFSFARLVAENLSSGAHRRGLSDSNQPGTIAADMMHVHHVDLPHAQPNLTLWDRAQDLAKRSKERLSYLSTKISGRRKTLGKSGNYSSPISSQQGDYVMQISVGTPPRKFLAYVATGSDLVWLQCTPCYSCFLQPDQMFDPTTSSTYIPMSCTDPLCLDLSSFGSCSEANACLYDFVYVNQAYSEGDMATETFSFTASDGSVAGFSKVGFGCGNDQGGLQGTYDGVVGLGDGKLSLVSQLGPYIGNVFSYCLVSYASAATVTSPLLLGSVGSTPLHYTRLIPNSFNPTYYYVNLVGITVNKQPVPYPNDTFVIEPTDGTGGLIIDAGTTATFLFDAAYTKFRAAIVTLVSYPLASTPNFDLCYDTSSVSTPVFPAVGFQLDGVELDLSSGNVFLPVDNAGTYCMFIETAGDFASISILGNVQQQNFNIAFDRANGRVGFGATTC